MFRIDVAIRAITEMSDVELANMLDSLPPLRRYEVDDLIKEWKRSG
jgi:hypothetical protein